MAQGHDEAPTQSLVKSSDGGARGRAYFLVLGGESSSLFHLPSTGTVLIGRVPEAQLRLEHASISRRHAQVHVAPGGAIAVEDLGSHNGTLVNGERVARERLLASGDLISVGEIALVLHRDERSALQRPLLDGPALRQRLDEEVARCLAYDRALSLVVIAPPEEEPAGAAWMARLAAQLRRIDVAGVEGRQLLVVMPEVDGDEAEQIVTGLLSIDREADRSAATAVGRAGVATFPADGCDGETLLAAARSALLGTASGEVRVAADASVVVQLGDRRVVVAEPAMVALYDLLRRLAASELPVLILGETGVGKENAAYAVHHRSRRGAGPFITVNCAALQENLVESELFGHEKGAFSGAAAAKPGLIEAASGGTLFLDEVGELPAAIQAKLLRALESKRITRLGAVAEREIDLRFVAATNRDLERDVEAGRFRRDLYFRLSAATVHLPPLRDRPREVAVLARTFLDGACLAAGRPPMTLAAPALHALTAYPWPGNVRELKNTMDFAAATVAESTLEAEHLPERISGRSRAGLAPATVAATAADAPAASFRPLAEELRDLERKRMIEALRAAGGNQRQAAALLAMPLRTFVLRVKQYKLASGG